MNNKEFIKRRKTLIEQMDDQSFALLSSGQAKHKSLDQHFKYFPERNFFYLTGLKREKFILLLVKNKKAMLDFIFIEEASDYATKWLGSRLSKEEVSQITGIDTQRIFYLNEFDNFISNRLLVDSRQLLLDRLPSVMYLDMFRAASLEKPVSFDTFFKIVENYPELTVKNINSMIAELRRFKSNDEVADIRKAIAHTKKGIYSIFDYAKAGVNERELEATFEYNIKLSGSTGVSFDTIVANGKNATVLHYVDNDQEILDGNLVLLDLGAYHNEYAADISRTFPVNGKFTQRQAELYQMVLDVNKETIKRVKPGIYVSELNEFAKNALAEGMIKLGLIKEKSEVSKYYYHNVSHYLGLDVHDVGTYSKKIEAGVVLTVEPGIYIEEEKIGIRIEDDILVTEDGYENLSKDIIKEIKDIEDYFNKKE
ncbi:aminopeptidase P family protein [Hujiaoplasma nucleasis]|uniref:Xaa-Pro aminopeptidase n=1 Tax=Hujiaoplasma nucleasis TaxID=2725268 RepID=A0A7L6MZN4_9MOLU|nr:aminopeptidase P family protein [Hujiaoplasma nucleasis]QLY39450.1 aminopeptidase P family protein [Hujiaoplasma nucleasis]